MKKFKVKSPSDLTDLDIDGEYIIPIRDYEYKVKVVAKKVVLQERTPESEKLYQERKAHGELMEKRAEELCPGEENYCWHEDKKKVYYGGDWEDGKDKFFTEEQLTTKFKETQKLMKEKEREEMKSVPRFSINDIIAMYEYSKTLGYQDFRNFLNEKGTEKKIFFKKKFN
jgi:hypothetical protein